MCGVCYMYHVYNYMHTVGKCFLQEPCLHIRDSIRSIISYCKRFPQTLCRLGTRHFTALENAIVEDCIEWCRKWKYDPSIAEYFVETQTKAIVRQSELKKITQQMESENAAAAPRPT